MTSSISSKPFSPPQASSSSTASRSAEVRPPAPPPGEARNTGAAHLRDSLIGQDSFQAAGARCPVDLGQTTGTDSASGADSGSDPFEQLSQLMDSLIEQLSSGDTDSAGQTFNQLLQGLGLGGEDSASATGESASGTGDTGGLDSLVQTLSQLASSNPEQLGQLLRNPELLQQLASNPELISSLSSQGASKAPPMQELSGISRFLGSGGFNPPGI